MGEKPELPDPNRGAEARLEPGEGHVAGCVQGGEAARTGESARRQNPPLAREGCGHTGGDTHTWAPHPGQPPTVVLHAGVGVGVLTNGPGTGGAHRRTARARTARGAREAPDSRPPRPDAWSAVVAAHGPTGSARGRAAPLVHRYVAQAHGQRRLEGFCSGLEGGRGVARTSRPWRVRSEREARRLGSCGTGLDRRARAHWEHGGGETEARQPFKGARRSPRRPSLLVGGRLSRRGGPPS